MRALIQRVVSANVHVDESRISQIGEGLLILVGIFEGDCDKDVGYIVNKTLNMRLFPNSENNFDDHPYVINGASELLCKIFQNKGSHTRFAVGVNNLPINASVEIDAIFSLKN